jgi:hypothetical protein
MMKNARKNPLAVLLSLPLVALFPAFAADPQGFAIWKVQDLKAFAKAQMLALGSRAVSVTPSRPGTSSTFRPRFRTA